MINLILNAAATRPTKKMNAETREFVMLAGAVLTVVLPIVMTLVVLLR